MCAIAGAEKASEVERMLSLMSYRGPDDSGTTDVGGFVMGMARLKIVDLSSPGLCPITLGDLTLVFNGELYNYVELRDELTKYGHTFNTSGDSEVLLHAFKEWGPDCLGRFDWMGAFVIHDGRSLFLARDIAGEKPLYYTRSPFRFASEAKALGDCYEFPRACYATFDLRDPDGYSLSFRSYWRPNIRPYQGTFEEALDELDALLTESVRLRTRADVPYGLYLSQGVDSTLISTYHDFEHTFTYEDGDYKEEFLKVFPEIVWHLDYPIKSFSSFGLWKLAEEASKKVKVVLSGEGADELFGGYVRFIPNEFNRKARELYPSYQALFPYKDMLNEEFAGNMQELLRMGDRMSAAWSIENRCPMLSRRVIEFAMSLPMEWKINGYETKVILRELLKRRKPDYQFEEKKGLFCSVNSWLGVPEEGFGKDTYVRRQNEIRDSYR